MMESSYEFVMKCQKRVEVKVISFFQSYLKKSSILIYETADEFTLKKDSVQNKTFEASTQSSRLLSIILGDFLHNLNLLSSEKRSRVARKNECCQCR